MINIFNDVYTLIDDALASYDNKIKTSSVYTNSPSVYPFVSVEEIDNYPDERTSDSCDIENHANLEYEINIYAQNPQKKSKCDAIAQVIDNLLKNYNFVRLSKTPLQDSNETIYRIIMRYRCVVSKDNVVYRR